MKTSDALTVKFPGSTYFNHISTKPTKEKANWMSVFINSHQDKQWVVLILQFVPLNNCRRRGRNINDTNEPQTAGENVENVMEICLLRSPHGSTHIWCFHLLLFVVSLVETGDKEVTRFMRIMIYALSLFLLQYLDFFLTILSKFFMHTWKMHIATGSLKHSWLDSGTTVHTCSFTMQ